MTEFVSNVLKRKFLPLTLFFVAVILTLSFAIAFLSASNQGIYRSSSLIIAVLFNPIHILTLVAILFVIFISNSYTKNVKSYLDRKFIPLFEEMESNVAQTLSSSNVYEGAISNLRLNIL